jgi:RNA polymerase sigma factor (sigma-70 family)
MPEEIEPSDADVMAASRSDPPAFAALFDRHAEAVYGYLDRRVGGDRADDLLSEVFRVAFERRGAWTPEHRSARPWLFGIASRLVLKEHRQEGRRLRALARLAARPGTADDGPGRVEEVLDARADADAVAEALLGLDARDRDVVVLVAWEGFSHDEVAAALDIPAGTVRSRLHRARRLLRERTAVGGSEGRVSTESPGPQEVRE